PQIETTKAVGLVFLPGAMTGLILAGTPPLAAVKVQAAVMYLVLGASATTTAVVGLGAQRRLFTPDDRLNVPARVARSPRPADCARLTLPGGLCPAGVTAAGPRGEHDGSDGAAIVRRATRAVRGDVDESARHVRGAARALTVRRSRRAVLRTGPRRVR